MEDYQKCKNGIKNAELVLQNREVWYRLKIRKRLSNFGDEIRNDGF